MPINMDAMLNELPDLLRDDAPDPDAAALSQQEQLEDEPLDLKDPAFAAELADDPVRLYLREIGQVKLLDAGSEFHLAIGDRRRICRSLRWGGIRFARD